MRVSDFGNMDRFAVKLKEVLDYHNFSLTEYYGVDAVDFDQTLALVKSGQRFWYR